MSRISQASDVTALTNGTVVTDDGETMSDNGTVLMGGGRILMVTDDNATVPSLSGRTPTVGW